MQIGQFSPKGSFRGLLTGGGTQQGLGVVSVDLGLTGLRFSLGPDLAALVAELVGQHAQAHNQQGGQAQGQGVLFEVVHVASIKGEYFGRRTCITLRTYSRLISKKLLP